MIQNEISTVELFRSDDTSSSFKISTELDLQESVCPQGILIKRFRFQGKNRANIGILQDY